MARITLQLERFVIRYKERKMARITLEQLKLLPKKLVTTEEEARENGWSYDWQFDCWNCKEKGDTYISVWIIEEKRLVLVQLAELEKQNLYWCTIPT